MKFRLNGWQRIGIVVSVIWFVGFAGIWFFGAAHNAETRHRYSMTRCNEDFEETNLREKCLQEAAGSSELAIELNREKLWQIFTIDFGLIVFGWLVAWIGVGIGRWIKRGSDRS